MNEINFYKNGDSYLSIIKYTNYEIEIDFNEVISYLQKNKKYIRSISFNGNDLTFYVGNQKVRLHNYKNFKKDKEFAFFFDIIREKRYKFANKAVEKGGIIFLSAVSALVIATYIKDSSLDLQRHIQSLENEKHENGHHFYIDWKDEYVDVDDEVVIEKQDTKENNIENQTIEKEEKYENNEETNNNLVCGSQANDEKATTTRNLYMPIIEKYCDMYNLDANLICAIATQERGIHSDTRDSSGAIGLMQIEVAIWNNETLNVFNYMDNKYDTIDMSEASVKYLENNIKAGCAVFQNCLNKFNGNICAAVQAYNMGYPTVERLINQYANNTGKSYDEILENNDLGWLEYRKNVDYGDSSYLENVLRYYNGDLKKAGLKI